jgi:O-methyltransferase
VKKQLRKLFAAGKGFVLLLRPGVLFGFLSKPLLFISNLLSLSRWIAAQKTKDTFNDFFNPKRDHANRYKLYTFLTEKESLISQPVDYLEFGVSQGHSFKWWSGTNKNPDSRFYGFDTFEGLPEQWGTFDKGAMAASIPQTDDTRCTFIKGIFQDTLFDFIKSTPISGKRKIIHLDADLFSATLFALTTLAPHLNKGDILLFDEFNVPNHEWMAYKIFVESFYLKTELLGAVNNYYQVAFKVL